MGDSSAFQNISTAAASGIVGLGSAEISGHQNRKFAREQRDYATNLSNTAYQRGMADMRKAGLNPMLAYMKGGADSPQGAMANQATADLMGSAKTGLLVAQQLRLLKAEVRDKTATATKNEAGVPFAILEEKIKTRALKETAPMIDRFLDELFGYSARLKGPGTDSNTKANPYNTYPDKNRKFTPNIGELERSSK